MERSEISAVGSGVWRALAIERDGDRLLARIADDGLPAGSYQLRARAFDRAGNEGSTDIGADGQPKILNLPLRVVAKLESAFERQRTIRQTVRRRGRTHEVRRRVTVQTQSARVLFGETAQVSGRLVNHDGNGIAGADVQVFASTPPSPEQLVGVVQTDVDGRYRYMAAGSVNRTLRFAYAGSSVVLPAQSQLTVTVPAAVDLRVDRSRLRNGQAVTFTGPLLTLPTPAGGKLIEMQVRLPGRWETFRTIRSDDAGRWSVRYRFRRTAGVQYYRFPRSPTGRSQLPVRRRSFAGGHSPRQRHMIMRRIVDEQRPKRPANEDPMASLRGHVGSPDDHAHRLFHPLCPVCRTTRLAGELRMEPLVSRRAQAAVTAGVLALTSVAPASASAADTDRAHSAGQMAATDDAGAPNLGPATDQMEDDGPETEHVTQTPESQGQQPVPSVAPDSSEPNGITSAPAPEEVAPEGAEHGALSADEAPAPACRSAGSDVRLQSRTHRPHQSLLRPCQLRHRCRTRPRLGPRASNRRARRPKGSASEAGEDSEEGQARHCRRGACGDESASGDASSRRSRPRGRRGASAAAAGGRRRRGAAGRQARTAG